MTLIPLQAPVVLAQTSGAFAIGATLSVEIAEYPLISILPGGPPTVDGQTTGVFAIGATLSVEVSEPPSVEAETTLPIGDYVIRGDTLIVHGTGGGRLAQVENVDGLDVALMQAWTGPEVDEQPVQAIPTADLLHVAAARELQALAETGAGSRAYRRSAAIAFAAGLIDLALADGDWVPVTGTGTCTDLGEVDAGAEFVLDLDAAVTFSMFGSLACGAGDQVTVRSRGGGTWQFVSRLDFTP